MRFSSAVEQPFQPSTNSSMVEQLTLNRKGLFFKGLRWFAKLTLTE